MTIKIKNDYTILRNTDIVVLERNVKDFMDEGWAPHGGLAFGDSTTVGKGVWAQAMINTEVVDVADGG